MKTINELKIELSIVQQQIKKLQPHDAILDNMPARIGGSGKYTSYFNKRRERYLERTIDAAKLLVPLYGKEKHLEQLIKDIESGEYEKRIKANETHKTRLIAAKVEYWKGLKVGDILDIGNPNGNPVITKKNAKSCETGIGCKWAASEIIGKDAAKLL